MRRKLYDSKQIRRVSGCLPEIDAKCGLLLGPKEDASQLQASPI
jgi:hypothetical protein